MASPYFDPEYENLSIKINPPRVSVDNSSCKDCSLVKVDSMNKQGILLEVVQILTDLDLIITKAYISSDGGWFMDVFHVTDQNGNKVTNSKTIEHIEKALGPKGQAADWMKTWPGKKVGVHSVGDQTAVELIGRDRSGLLSEIFAVLSDLHFNITAAEVWTHNRRIACFLYVNDIDTTSRAVDDFTRLSALKEQLKNVLGETHDDDHEQLVARTSFSVGSTHVDRRLHQMLFAVRDYEGGGGGEVTNEREYHPFPLTLRPKISIEHCKEKGYSVVTVKSKDRPKLMFDIVCTLTDMQYVVFHATISSDGPYASQEYFIRHMDGCTLDTEGDKDRVIKCLEAAVQRRASEDLSLELCGKDRVGLLSEMTRVLRENGLSVIRVGASTIGEKATNVFYVRDASGNTIDMRIIEALRKEVERTMMLNVKKAPIVTHTKAPHGENRGLARPRTSFFFGSLLEKFLP